MNSLFAREFPLIAARYKQCAQALGIKALYGYFYNFCVNHPGSKPRVHCGPHVDWKNLAVGICVLFVYGVSISLYPCSFSLIRTIGNFNSSERCWLVIWEAGVVLEMPPGVFLMYPSSLFVHFNIDICGKYQLRAQCVNTDPAQISTLSQPMALYLPRTIRAHCVT